MLYSTSRCWILLLLLAVGLTFSCVSKGKYYAALQEKAVAKSELGNSSLDLKDARSEIERQEALILGLRQEIARLGTSVTDLSDERKSEQLQIGASLNKTQQELEEYHAMLALANKQLGTIKQSISARNTRLTGVAINLETALSNLPKSQFRIEQKDDNIVVQFEEGLFFIRNSDKLSDFGNGLILNLVSSLGGQKDLLFDLVAYPTISAGTMKSWQSASERANVIAFEFVSRYGLSPKQVSATGKQGEIVIIDGAPAESKQRKTVELIIRLNPLNYPMPKMVN